ncbi:MAG: NADH-quinone oxidoreductase subunit L [Candidatus Zixiibacteriota bacterium]|nr:MAG: NADH-quinone oxidoreductase subunit L [candidate division Zixibacteria bacterium]
MLPYSWIIAALPLLAFILIVFFLNRSNKISSYFSIAMVLTSFVLSCIVLVQVLDDPAPKEYWVDWLTFGDYGMSGAGQITTEFESDESHQIPKLHPETIEPEYERHESGDTLDIAIDNNAEDLDDITLIAAIHHEEPSEHDSEHHLSFKEPQRHGKKGSFVIPLGIYIDPLTAIMLMVVSIVAGLVQIYSLGYMKGDPRFARYYAYLSLFTFSMLGLVLAGSYILMFVFWELVGLTSYLLIGFWFEKKIASDAGKKAFVTTKIGDLGFLLGLAILIFAVGSASLPELDYMIANGQISENLMPLVAIAGILMFCGAVGKSAQFPLHVWLPDAMEGPTPVSALIHAATMVAAGVYLAARMMGIIMISETMMYVVASIGAFTAFLAASIGLVQNDIKRVLAYSTVSQLGYMMMALGLAGFTAGTFHLMTHAFFKALLFLAAGSVIHAVHTNDIQYMGGLSKKMKITSKTFLIASLSISGIFPLSGFWSKDEIFAVAFEGGHYPFLVVGILVAGMTAFYMFRLYFLTFTGEPRDKHAYEHAHESPKNMTVPLIILAVLSVCAGWVGIPWLYKGYSSFVFYGAVHHADPNIILMLISLIVASSGIGLAYVIYVKKTITAEAIGRAFKPIYTFLYNKWYFDELYMATIINPTYWFMEVLFKFDQLVIDGIVNGFGKVTLFTSWIHERFDTYVVDGAVNGAGYMSMFFGKHIRKIQTGQLQTYALFVFLGAVVFMFIKLI